MKDPLEQLQLTLYANRHPGQLDHARRLVAIIVGERNTERYRRRGIWARIKETFTIRIRTHDMGMMPDIKDIEP